MILVDTPVAASPQEVSLLSFFPNYDSPRLGQIDFVKKVIAAHPSSGELFYARVDIIRHEVDQSWCLAELELIEPYLFFKACPAAADVLASKLAEIVR